MYNVWVTILLVSLTIVHPVVQLIPLCMQAFCTRCISCCIVLDSHACLLTVYAKCILCLRKDVHILWLKIPSFWVPVHELQWEEKMLSPCSPFNCNVQLPLAANKNKTFHIRKFCYTGQTTASRIGFWYSYKQQEVATCSYFWPQVRLKSSS